MRDRAINDLYYIRIQFDFFSVASEHIFVHRSNQSLSFPHWTELKFESYSWAFTRLSFDEGSSIGLITTSYLLTFAHVVWSASLSCLSIDSIYFTFSIIAMFSFKIGFLLFNLVIRIEQITNAVKKTITTHLSIISITLRLTFSFVPL